MTSPGSSLIGCRRAPRLSVSLEIGKAARWVPNPVCKPGGVLFKQRISQEEFLFFDKDSSILFNWFPALTLTGVLLEVSCCLHLLHSFPKYLPHHSYFPVVLILCFNEFCLASQWMKIRPHCGMLVINPPTHTIN